MPSEKLDLYKLHRDEYVTPKKPRVVETEPAQYLTITGSGEPGGDVFTTRLGALYSVAYTLKFNSKAAGRDYKVAPLEGLWWGPAPGGGPFDLDRASLKWKLLVRVPDFITAGDVETAAATCLEKGKGADVSGVGLETMGEGTCLQVLHVGPYGEEPKTIELMETCAREQGLTFHGLHHEIYLSDPRRVPPERLRTILRFPVKAAA